VKKISSSNVFIAMQKTTLLLRPAKELARFNDH